MSRDLLFHFWRIEFCNGFTHFVLCSWSGSFFSYKERMTITATQLVLLASHIKQDHKHVAFPNPSHVKKEHQLA